MDKKMYTTKEEAEKEKWRVIQKTYVPYEWKPTKLKEIMEDKIREAIFEFEIKTELLVTELSIGDRIKSWKYYGLNGIVLDTKVELIKQTEVKYVR